MSWERPRDRFFPVQRVDKPWGHELLWAWTDDYVGKVLHVRDGESLSLQYHERKDETISVLSGRIRLEHASDGDGLQAREMAEGESYRVLPGTRHRITALGDATLLEASTPELDDVVRLEDRYGRVTPRTD